MFGGGLADLRDDDLEPLASEIGCADVPRAELDHGVGIVDLLVRTGLTKSKSEATRLIAGGGVSLNDERVTAAARTVTTADLATPTFLLLRSGKRNYKLVRAR